MNNQENSKLEAELLLLEAKIMCSKASIKKFEIEIEILKQKISNNKLERNVSYTDDGETMFIKTKKQNKKERNVSYTDDGETVFNQKDLSCRLQTGIEQNLSKIMIESQPIDSGSCVAISSTLEDLTEDINPSTIKDSDMEGRGVPFKFLLEDTIISHIKETFVEDDSPLNEPPPEWTIGKFYDELDNRKMTVERLSVLLNIEIDYNYGDFINFDDNRNENIFIVGKKGVLYRNPDNSCSGGISIPLEISKYLYDSVEKYKDVAYDIELGYKDDILKNYIFNHDEMYNYKFIWYMIGAVYYEKYGLSYLLEKKPMNKENKITNSKLNLNLLKGTSIVFTGGKDKELLTLFNQYNIKIVYSVTKYTSLLIAKDKNEKSTKILKAKELKIPIYTLEDVKEHLL